MEVNPRSRIAADPFCHVERRSDGVSRHYVVHAQAPRVVVEMEAAQADADGRRRGVIRRVTMANSWSGDYHLGGKLLGAAVSSFEKFLESSVPSNGVDPDVL